MKCLMVSPEDAGDIIIGELTSVDRAWSTDHRGDFLIGCKETPQSNSFICAVASLDDVTFDAEQNVYTLHFSKVRGVKPIPVTGKLRLFETGIGTYEVLDSNNEAEVNAAYDAAESWMMKKSSKARKG